MSLKKNGQEFLDLVDHIELCSQGFEAAAELTANFEGNVR